MKNLKWKIKRLSIALLLTSSVAFGQDTNTQAFTKGTNLINIGTGLGGYYYYWGAGYSGTPNFVLQYENGTFGNVGPGTISLGAQLSYKAITDDWIGNDGYNYSQQWRYWVLGFRSAYHLTVPGAPKFDPYAGIMLGYYFLGYTFETDNPNYRTPGNPAYVYYTATYPSYFYPSLFLGARYSLSRAVAIWGELGYGYTTFDIGASFRL